MLHGISTKKHFFTGSKEVWRATFKPLFLSRPFGFAIIMVSVCYYKTMLATTVITISVFIFAQLKSYAKRNLLQS